MCSTSHHHQRYIICSTQTMKKKNCKNKPNKQTVTNRGRPALQPHTLTTTTPQQDPVHTAAPQTTPPPHWCNMKTRNYERCSCITKTWQIMTEKFGAGVVSTVCDYIIYTLCAIQVFKYTARISFSLQVGRGSVWLHLGTETYARERSDRLQTAGTEI